MKNMDLNFQWAAGFIEGEGTFYFRKPQQDGWNAGFLEMKVCQKEPEALYMMQDALGGLGSITGPYDNTNGQPIYYWNPRGMTQDEVVSLMWKLYPYMSPRRQVQMSNILDRHMAAREASREAKKYCRRGIHLREEGQSRCITCRKEQRKLNGWK